MSLYKKYKKRCTPAFLGRVESTQELEMMDRTSIGSILYVEDVEGLFLYMGTEWLPLQLEKGDVSILVPKKKVMDKFLLKIEDNKTVDVDDIGMILNKSVYPVAKQFSRFLIFS